MNQKENEVFDIRAELELAKLMLKSPTKIKFRRRDGSSLENAFRSKSMS